MEIRGNQAWQIASNDPFTAALLYGLLKDRLKISYAVPGLYREDPVPRGELRSSWPQTSRHSHTNYIPRGSENTETHGW